MHWFKKKKREFSNRPGQIQEKLFKLLQIKFAFI